MVTAFGIRDDRGSGIDTPALVVDIEALEENIEVMARTAAAMGANLRPHAKAHKSMAIAVRQLERGAVGLCCQKVSEAAVFAGREGTSILITNEVIGDAKLDRFAELAASGDVQFCVDSDEWLVRYDAAARRNGLVFGLLIDVQGGWYRPGVKTAAEVVELAVRISAHPHLEFRGLQAYNAAAQHIPAAAERLRACERYAAVLEEAIDGLAVAGLDCAVVTGAGTGSHDIDPKVGPYTEIQPGSYVFMDGGYLANEHASDVTQGFRPSLLVATTVMSRPSADVAVVDCGVKAISLESGMPLVLGSSGSSVDAEYVRGADEHGTLRLRDDQVSVGERLLLLPHNVDPTVNLHHRYFLVKGGSVVGEELVDAQGATW